MRLRTIFRTFPAALAAIGLCTPAEALLFRAYLAAGGNDANPCTLAAPCRLLPAAVAAVAPGGEIWMLDSANYNTGQVSIAKSVTVMASPGVLGSLVTTGGYQAAIATSGAGTRVTLRNLTIVRQANTGDGIGVQVAGGQLRMEGCTIRGTTSGVVLYGGAEAVVVDSLFSDISSAAVEVHDASATVQRSTIVRSWMGLWAIAPESTIHVTDSVVAYGWYGIYTSVSSGAGRAFSARSFYAGTINAVTAHGDTGAANSLLELSGNIVTGSATGVRNEGGLIQTSGNNRVVHNATDVVGSLTPTPSY